MVFLILSYRINILFRQVARNGLENLKIFEKFLCSAIVWSKCQELLESVECWYGQFKAADCSMNIGIGFWSWVDGPNDQEWVKVDVPAIQKWTVFRGLVQRVNTVRHLKQDIFFLGPMISLIPDWQSWELWSI